MIGVVIFTLKTLFKNTSVQNFPSSWKTPLNDHVRFYRKLSIKDKVIFRKRMMLFLSEIAIEGVQTTVTDLDKILIAASAVIPVFNFKEWHYNNLSTVLLYPSHFNKDLSFDKNDSHKNIAGLVGTGRYEGQMILSKKALYYGFKNDTDKGNTAVHEFVHLLDKVDGVIDGIPERLMQRQYITPWLQLMHKEMEAINNATSDIRNYGATSEIEFFAVASEYFFERPKLFKRKHPELYQMLLKCFSNKIRANKLYQ